MRSISASPVRINPPDKGVPCRQTLQSLDDYEGYHGDDIKFKSYWKVQENLCLLCLCSGEVGHQVNKAISVPKPGSD